MYLNIYNKISVILDNMPEKYLHFFVKQLGIFKGEHKENTCPSTLTINCVDNMKLDEPEIIFFGDMCYGRDYLYFSLTPDRKMVGISMGENCASIIFENGIEPWAVFYLADILIRNLAPEVGIAFMHASGALLNDTAYIFPAWGGVGKTDLLTIFLKNGARYIGDDSIIVDGRGSILPFPKPLHILHYNLDSNKFFLKFLNNKMKFNYHIFKIMSRLQKNLSNIFSFKSVIGKSISSLKKHVESKIDCYIFVDDVFGSQVMPPLTAIRKYKIFFINKRNGRSIESKEMKAGEIAEKMSHCLRWEKNYGIDFITAYLYAFPQKEKLIKGIFEKERQVMEKCFSCAQSINLIEYGKDSAPAKFYTFLFKQ